jgi:hypothetical protein
MDSKQLINSIKSHINTLPDVACTVTMVNPKSLVKNNVEYVCHITNKEGDFSYGEVRFDLKNKRE